MDYTPQTPIAVFLGPTLSHTDARRLLAANYYPPARMGDSYRLLGSGVRVIVLIDGVFHQTASVWQRELLEALDNQIVLIGAASMGALRAAELHPFGMVGHGTIFSWYCNGVIEGDDEVALNHTDDTLGFRPLSEPLVNIRFTLQQAVELAYISQAQSNELLTYAKQTYYPERSYPSLLNSPAFNAWSPSVQTHLRQFIQQQASNLKSEDAKGALRYVARLINQEDLRPRSSLLARQQGRYYRSVAYHHRGFFQKGGTLVSGAALLAEALKDSVLLKTLQPILRKNYFLRLWANQRNITCPPDYLQTYQQTWFSAVDDQWLRANGITAVEFQAALAERALLTWLVQQNPLVFGLDFAPYWHFCERLMFGYENCDRSVSETGIKGTEQTQQPSLPCAHLAHQVDGCADLLKQATEVCYLATWAYENGIVCPPTRVEKFTKKWEETLIPVPQAVWLATSTVSEVDYRKVLAAWACQDWLIEKGPLYFGYTTWSFEVALLQELQITGQAARMVGEMH